MNGLKDDKCAEILRNKYKGTNNMLYRSCFRFFRGDRENKTENGQQQIKQICNIMTLFAGYQTNTKKQRQRTIRCNTRNTGRFHDITIKRKFY